MSSRLVVCLCAAISLSLTAYAGKEHPSSGEPTKADEFLIKLNASADPNSILANVENSPLLHGRIFHLKHVPKGLDKLLANSPLVDYIEPNRIRSATLSTPNDPNYAAQWDLVAIHALQAWSLVPNQYYTASNLPGGRVKVAVIDTGADCTHPDFMNAAGTSTDSASGGQLNFAQSSAYVVSTIKSVSCLWADDNGHGTHVAGTIAAATQNATGVAGLAYPVQLLVYKVLDSTGSGTDATIANAMMQATDAGAQVISLSLGGDGYSQALQDAVTYAWQHNVMVVAAAGNSATNAITFPAAASHAIGVSATDQTNNLASFSNYGNYVTVGAPGVSILSTLPTYTTARGITYYGTLSGTSMATPHVSGLAGLVATTTPNVAMDAVALRIQQTAASTYSNGGWFQNLGYGMIDVAAAVGGNLRTSTVGSIVGQIADNTGGLGGATVSAGGTTYTTASDGLFRIANLSSGTYTISFTASGYSPITMTVNVPAGADVNASVRMDMHYGQLSGYVTDGGVGAPNVVVQALSGGLISGTAVTDSVGHYNLPVPAGTYTLRTSAVAESGTTSGSVTVAAGASTTANLTISRLGWITGLVSDPNNTPIPSQQVSIVSSGFTAGAVTDSTGRFSTVGLPAGSYTVRSSYGSLADATATVTVGGDAAVTANLQFSGATGGATTTFSAIRVAAGGTAFTDANGNAWAADNGYNGGATYSTGASIANTTTPRVYQNERWSSSTLQYTFSVPNGSYNVNLKFAEIYFNSAGQRVFNIAVNGTTVQANFDPFAAAGAANTAVDRSYPVTVSNGQITIALVPVVSNPKISGIEILASTTSTTTTTTPPPSTTVFTPIRVNAGGGAYTDPNGNVWSADTGSNGGSTYATGAAIANTNTTALYQTERWSSSTLQYTFTVPNGTYNVNLKFAEIYFNSAAQRVFNIALNGTTVQTNFDPFAAAGGANTAVDKGYSVSVTNGQIVIALIPVVSNPKISAIEIIAGTISNPAPASTFTPVRVNAGGPGFTDSTGNVWAADSGSNGGGTYSVTSAIANTATPYLYQSERWSSSTLQYTFNNITSGAHTVVLKFAEIYFTSCGQRIFNIAINGATVETNFDPCTAAGGSFKAIDRSYSISVPGSQVVVSLIPVVSNPKISAIEID